MKSSNRLMTLPSLIRQKSMLSNLSRLGYNTYRRCSRSTGRLVAHRTRIKTNRCAVVPNTITGLAVGRRTLSTLGFKGSIHRDCVDILSARQATAEAQDRGR